MKKLLIGLLCCLMVFACATGCSLLLPPSTSDSVSNSETNSSDTPATSDTASDSDSDSSVADLYTLTLRNGNPMLDGTSESSELAEGATLTLPTLTADGKEFLGWYSMDENGDLTVSAPETMPAADLALYAKWNVIPYTVTIVNGETTESFTFGVEAVEGSVDCTVDSVAWNLATYLPNATDSVLYTWAETVPDTFALQNYTFTVVENALYTLTLRNGNPMLGGTSESSKLVEGAELELETLTADGKEFLGWYSMDENGDLTVSAPETMPAADLALYATWEVIPYTLTIVNGDTTESFTFGVETTMTGIDLTVNDLVYVLEDNLPTNTIDTLYSWEEEVPDTFELKDYTFTVKSEAAPTYTLTLINGNQRLDPNAVTTSEKYAGAALELETLTADGKEFLGWYSMDENGDLTVSAPETMPAAALTLYATWEVTLYTLTIKQVGAEDKVFTFGVEYTNDILLTVSDLAYVLADNLPTSTETAIYEYAEEIPETFTAQAYTFNINEIKTLSIPEANTLGAAQAHDTYTTDEYIVNGTIVHISNTTYGNIYIADENGNIFYAYGLYLEDGTRYDSMSYKPVVGDIIKIRSAVGQYNGTPQMYHPILLSCSTPETVGNIYKAIAESFALSVTETIVEAGDVTVATAGTSYTDVAISWASSDTSIASVSGGTITYTLPTAATEITLTATLTCGEASYSKAFTVKVSAAPSAGETTVTLIMSTISGTQYADESYVINEFLTISTHNGGCSFNTQLRIYDSTSNDGWAILTCAGAISNIELNIGYKKADLLVSGSTDGTTWEEIGTITTTSTGYLDYSLDIDESKGYTYLKLDASGNQLRIASLAVTMIG